VASNQRADQLLSKTTVGVRLDDLFTTHRNHILGHPPQSALQLSTKNRVRLSVKVQRPTVAQIRPPTGAPSAAVRQTKVTNTNSADFSALEYGDATVRRCAEHSLKVLERGVPVLITGETGVGKEVLVKALHQATQRKEQALVAVNCAAIPPELVESELFGYEAGAFTGARAQGSLGFIRKAHKGILFLDEIGEMPLSAQSRLLRVLQERVVTPVGATDSIAVDILLITATNRAPALHLESGQLRADLYYRINGLCVELPALRDRTDKHKLVQHIYSQYRDPVQSEALSPRVLAALIHHPWPGNIRQLVNVVRVAVAIADGEDLQIWHLPADFLAQLDFAAASDQSDAVISATGGNGSKATLGELKKAAPKPLAHTLQVYQKCMGNVSSTARELSISRNTLYKRLRELGVR
jgi:transcriptional regulator of acetoin/glycerol metabolism